MRVENADRRLADRFIPRAVRELSARAKIGGWRLQCAKQSRRGRAYLVVFTGLVHRYDSGTTAGSGPGTSSARTAKSDRRRAGAGAGISTLWGRGLIHSTVANFLDRASRLYEQEWNFREATARPGSPGPLQSAPHTIYRRAAKCKKIPRNLFQACCMEPPAADRNRRKSSGFHETGWNTKKAATERPNFFHHIELMRYFGGSGRGI
jgi:hypothetical protein